MTSDSTDDADSWPLQPSGGEDELIARYCRGLASIPLLTPEEEKELSRQIKEGGPTGKAAYDRLVRANLRLVVSIARQCRRRRHGVPMLDLIQDGNLGLMRAATDFDGDRGCRFSTYAVWWISNCIMRGKYSQHGATTPKQHDRHWIAKMRQASRKFTQDNQREPTDLELAGSLGIPLKKLWILQRAARQPVSLDTPIYEEGSGETLSDRIPSPENATPLARLERDSLRELLTRAASRLKAKELQIIKLRFGLEDGKEWTLEEIGDRFGRTSGNIHGTLVKALRKLRRSPLWKELAKQLDD